MSRTTSSIRLSDIPTDIPRDGEGRIMLGPEETRDRLDKLEAQCTDLFRQLRNMRGENGQRVAEIVAHLEQATDRMDSTDRRVAAINAGLMDAGDLLFKHEDQIKTISGLATMGLEAVHRRINNANNYFNMLADYLGLQLDPTADGPRLIPKEGVTPMFVRVGNLQDRVTVVELGLQFIQHSNQRLVDLGTGTTASPATKWDSLSEPARLGCNCWACQAERRQNESPADALERGFSKPQQHRKSLGWINIYGSDSENGSGVVGFHETRDEADRCADKRDRLACIEIFEGDGL